MLEVRFNILNKYVDKFMVAEAKYSHSGEKKKLNFDINKFSEFKKKIIYIVIDNEPNDVIYQKKDNSKLKLTPLVIETDDIDVTNNEAVVKDGKSIGYITSGGFAHYVNKSIAYSYLDEETLKSNEKFQVEINGNFYNCSIIKEALYDPTGERMRS